jgi:PKHD-type hydroxylase
MVLRRAISRIIGRPLYAVVDVGPAAVPAPLPPPLGVLPPLAVAAPPGPEPPPPRMPTQAVVRQWGRAAEPGTLKMWVASPPFASRRVELFSPGECADIVAMHETRSVTEQNLGDWRSHHAFWLADGDDTKWVFDRLRVGVAEYNEAFDYELTDDPGALQLTRYRPGHHYNWHMDLGAGTKSLRKLSISVELSTGYDGGGLEIFYWHSGPMRVPLGRGDAVIYPAFAIHRVPAIRSGERWSLVAWFCGPKPLR